jgi:hypothetical protein
VLGPIRMKNCSESECEGGMDGSELYVGEIGDYGAEVGLCYALGVLFPLSIVSKLHLR